ncbi:SDR family oxidoreductase [Allorhodopirellula heiligendammensis]|uniref:Linear gramicidin synthase subunit D n=1 Tax=Allorhodopirellula heiligendammensis TaxID=2714739 RepID=A0A5C6C275_9BACT|nr:SDR family oxidoreductase [Allorhodopirellula heiligendammensis]TWU18670.1 Linear gramicidin synthase subunit D [Allorhodopirellula heiligendammensis]
MRTRSHRNYVILTGATGLLGEYLIRDLVAKGVSLAVIARPSRNLSADQRVAAICRRWQRLSGQALPRPVVLEGHLNEPGWGLSRDQHRWIANNCDCLLNNAASLEFVAASREAEPWKTNFHGTERMLELAENWGIADLHHVSTAYVCGRRTGKILETELDEGQQFGNDYESSKCASELMVRAASDCFESTTILRPAIITGDYYTGYTSTFHGLYAPLKIAASLLHRAPLFEVSEQSLVATLGLSGDEEKNFVPVDWVSNAISSIVCDRDLHGRTYHLTAERRTSCELLADEMHEVFSEHALEVLWQEVEKSKASRKFANGKPTSPKEEPTFSVETMQASFRSQMEIYQAYWRNDPVFDRTQLTAALPHLPPPAVDRECIRRLCRYALKKNFGWPRPPVVMPAFNAAAKLRSQGFHSQPQATSDVRPSDLNLRILGDGGGDFAVRFSPDNAEATWVNAGFDVNQTRTCVMSAATLQRLIDEDFSLPRAISLGAVVMMSASRTPGTCSGTDVHRSGEGRSGHEMDFCRNSMERWMKGLSEETTQHAYSIPR